MDETIDGFGIILSTLFMGRWKKIILHIQTRIICNALFNSSIEKNSSWRQANSHIIKEKWFGKSKKRKYSELESKG